VFLRVCTVDSEGSFVNVAIELLNSIKCEEFLEKNQCLF
jgi:hypothetical protein